jgi:hypothetical protein
MAKYVTAIRTSDGDKKIDYTALANLPKFDEVPTPESDNLMDSNAIYETFVDYDETVKELFAKVYTDLDGHIFPADQIDGILSIEHGGTDAGSATTALENLGAASKYHRHMAEEVDVSADLAELVGLNETSPVDDVLSIMATNINDIFGIINGTSTKYKWNKLQWTFYETTTFFSVGNEIESVLPGAIKFSQFKIRYADNYTQDPQSGEISLVEPITEIETGDLPAVGKYFIVAGSQWSGGKWSNVCRVTEGSRVATEIYKYMIGSDPNDPEDYKIMASLKWENVTKLVPTYKYCGSVYDDDGNANPNKSWKDGYYYVREDRHAAIPTVISDEYIGNGSDTVHLPAFSRTPIIIVISKVGGGSSVMFSYGASSVDNMNITWGENETTIGSKSLSSNPLNVNGVTYKYMALCC